MFGAIILTIISSLFVSEGDVRFYVSTSRYLDNIGVTWLEMYINIPSNISYSSLDLDFKVFNNSDSQMLSTNWSIDIPRTEARYSVVDNFSFDVADEYTIRITLAEPVSGKEGWISFRASPLESEVMLSDVLFSNSISPTEDTGSLVKNGLLIYPLFDREMTLTNPKLIAYYEIYPGGQEDTVSVISSVFDSKGNEIWRYVSFVNRVEAGSFVGKVINIPIGDFEDGEYSFKVSSGTTERTEKFTVLWEPVETSFAPGEMEMSELAKLYYMQIEAVLNVSQLQVYQALDANGRDNFARVFWYSRDPNPMTPENEELELFAQRMDYADKNFSSGFEKGTSSDRGRIYIKNGKPEEIIFVPADDRYVPNEIWIYWRYSRKYIFADISGHGLFKLVYSNDPNETNYPNWERYTNENLGEVW